MMKEIKIRSISFSPGYGDMLGGYHSVSLEKNRDGKWTYVCNDREHYNAPTVVSTYAVSEEAVAQFEEFILKKRVISLEKRPKSNLFATDYSQWSWSIDYDVTSFGKTRREYCNFDEYKKYTGHDYDILNELEERFEALRGEKISETT